MVTDIKLFDTTKFSEEQFLLEHKPHNRSEIKNKPRLKHGRDL